MILSDWHASVASPSNDARLSSEDQTSEPTGTGIALLSTTAGEPGAPVEVAKTTKHVVSWDAWRRIDEEELRRGEKLGKIREKILCESYSAAV